MQGYRIGKSSIGKIRFRIMRFLTYCFLPVGWVLHNNGITFGGILLVWTCWQAFGFLFLFIGASVCRVCMNVVCWSNPAYHRWLAAGGDPFYDNIFLPFNADPNTVKVAIGTPPSVTHCFYCNVPLGTEFANCCPSCGTEWDNC